MDIQDFTPAGAGSLREPAGTFTPTRYIHPDEHWSPIGGEFEQGHGMPHLAAPVGGSAMQQAGAAQDAEPGRADTGDGFDLQGTARMIRSALRPGV